MPRTAILYIAQRCNQRCVFCLEEDRAWRELQDPSEADVFGVLNSLRGRGAEHITFMGGETFFRKDLPDIITEAKRLGYTRIGVTTNGTVLSKAGFVQRLCAAGLDFIELSIHGHTEALSTEVSRTAITFDRQARAMQEIDATQSLHTIVNVVVCRENHKHLTDVARYVSASLPSVPLRFKYKFVSLQGWASDQAEQGRDGDKAPQALRYEEVDFVGLGDVLVELGRDFWFYNVPLCHLGPHAHRAHEVATLSVDERYFDLDHRSDRGYYDSAQQLEGRVWPGCAPCRLRSLCPGVEESYRRVNGLPPLHPRDDDPRAAVEFAMQERGVDPALASARLTELATLPRPERFVLGHPEGALRFADAQGVVLDVEIEAWKVGERSWKRTPRFTVSYRSGRDQDPPEHAWPLLEAVLGIVQAGDDRGDSLDEVREQVMELRDDAWTLDPRSEAAVAERKQGKGLRIPKSAPPAQAVRLPMFER